MRLDSGLLVATISALKTPTILSNSAPLQLIDVVTGADQSLFFGTEQDETEFLVGIVIPKTRASSKARPTPDALSLAPGATDDTVEMSGDEDGVSSQIPILRRLDPDDIHRFQILVMLGLDLKVTAPCASISSNCSP